jgi:hypothetical protein
MPLQFILLYQCKKYARYLFVLTITLLLVQLQPVAAQQQQKIITDISTLKNYQQLRQQLLLPQQPLTTLKTIPQPSVILQPTLPMIPNGRPYDTTNDRMPNAAPVDTTNDRMNVLKVRALPQPPTTQ